MTGRDDGFTLVELLVGMVLVALFSSLVIGAAVNASRTTDATTSFDELSSEARLALIRMSRELRQASEISSATVYSSGPYAASGGVQAITFGVDFNGNGVIDSNAPDPEVLTYEYVPPSSGSTDGEVQLLADSSGQTLVRPILVGHVSSFHLELRSSLWACDANADGVTTWQELDTSTLVNCPHPDNNGVLDANELQEVDAIVIDFTVAEGTHQQHYRSQVDLRNVGVSPGSGN